LYEVVLSERARKQLIKTLLYTQKQFGAHKREEYVGLIEEALTILSVNPQSGKKRPDIH